MKVNVPFESQYKYLLLLLLVPLLLIGLYTYQDSKQDLVDASFTQLQSVNNTKEELLSRLFEQHKQNLTNLRTTVKILRKKHREYIENIQHTKIRQLDNYFESIEKTLGILSKNEALLTLLPRRHLLVNSNGSSFQL